MIEQGPESGKFTVSELCSRFSPNNSKSMEQRIRRAVNAGLTNLANMGLEDYSNDTFHDLAGTLYSFCLLYTSPFMTRIHFKLTKILVNFLGFSIALTRKVVNMENKKSRPSFFEEGRELSLIHILGQGVWLDSETLGPEDEVGQVLRHGTLTIGFIGLAASIRARI